MKISEAEARERNEEDNLQLDRQSRSKRYRRPLLEGKHQLECPYLMSIQGGGGESEVVVTAMRRSREPLWRVQCLPMVESVSCGDAEMVEVG